VGHAVNARITTRTLNCSARWHWCGDETSIDLNYIDYTKQRTAFGKPVWSFKKYSRFKLAECNTIILPQVPCVMPRLSRHWRKKLTVQHAALIKHWVTEKQMHCDECVQLFGGYGYMMEYPSRALYADARVQKIYGGTNEIMKELASRLYVILKPGSADQLVLFIISD
jgi:alkylation response protein AidB-like acyl-CoA dehydrogenase